MGPFNTARCEACHGLEADISTDDKGKAGCARTAPNCPPCHPHSPSLPGTRVSLAIFPSRCIEPATTNGASRALSLHQRFRRAHQNTLAQSRSCSCSCNRTLFTPSSGPAAGGTVVKVKHQLLGGAQQKSGGRSRLAIMPARSWCFFSFSSQASPRPRPRLPAPLPLPVPLSIPGADIVRIVMMAEAQRWKMEWRYESQSRSQVACIVLSRSGSWQFPRAVVPSDSRPSRLSALPDCRVCFYGALAHEAGSDLGASTWSH